MAHCLEILTVRSRTRLVSALARLDKTMNEEEVLYDALRSPLGLVVKGSKVAFSRAKTKLAQSDPAISELALIGPDPAGNLYILRTDQARQQAVRKEQV